ncbi:MAG: diguanylate cyclase [Armatimonadota bacterium]|nr:diguanylate cyclase [Armatimonadota bacterium]MDR7452592.1 diguanylate cyclase [Armatimonadota bacterium]MDR7468247.1 diguanylate cyclase [Armatimonadota bacterium]MDR7495241.1 diguanylate cyclase [Armatimonadota bacterium]MDR7500488.1 diguanylate cyclase [Armatimonadota bacterium]
MDALIPRLLLAGLAVVAAALLFWRAAGAVRTGRRRADQAELVGRVFKATDAILGSLDVQRVLPMVCEVGTHLSGHSGAAVLFLAEDGRAAPAASWGLSSASGDGAFTALESHAAEVLRTGRALILRLQPDHRSAPGDVGRFRAVCGLPLRRKSGVIGALLLLSEKAPGAYQGELSVLEYFAAQAATAIENARLYQQVQNLFLSTIKALAAAVDAKDAYTHGHSEDIAELVAMLAAEMKLPPQEEEKVRLAGLLHDIGKIGIPDAILQKPGALDASERAIMMTHASLGASIIDRPGPLRDLVTIVRHHHERYDGQGYPDGLRGDAIPIGAAILAVADAFDAMTSHRTYHAARDVDSALEEIRRHAGTQFHPAVVEALVRVVERERRLGSPWYRNIRTRVLEGEPAPPPVRAAQAAADEGDLVRQVVQQIRDAEDLHEVADRLARATAHLLQCGHAAVLLRDDERRVLRVEASTGAPLPGSVLPRSRSTPWLALERRAEQRQADGDGVCAPLLSAGRAVGVVMATGGAFTESAMRLLARAAEAVAPAVDAALARAEVKRLSATDEVTGLLNRRALVTRLREEARRHERYGTRFALALADVRALAEFNALHGYAAGDEMLRRLGEVMLPAIRKTDFLARLDGGTFGLLMPEIDYAQAAQAVNRIRELVEGRDVAVRGRFIMLPLLTWALASCPVDGTDPDALLALAEKRLYHARARVPG